MTKIYLVQGDTKPRVYVDLTDGEDGPGVDVTGATTVTLFFRRVGGTEVLSEIPCTIEPPSTVSFKFPLGMLDIQPGEYEGEMRFFFGSDIQTLYRPLKFSVRAKF